MIFVPFYQLRRVLFVTSLVWGLAFPPSFFYFISFKKVFFPIQTRRRMHGFHMQCFFWVNDTRSYAKENKGDEYWRLCY